MGYENLRARVTRSTRIRRYQNTMVWNRDLRITRILMPLLKPSWMLFFSSCGSDNSFAREMLHVFENCMTLLFFFRRSPTGSSRDKRKCGAVRVGSERLKWACHIFDAWSDARRGTLRNSWRSMDAKKSCTCPYTLAALWYRFVLKKISLRICADLDCKAHNAYLSVFYYDAVCSEVCHLLSEERCVFFSSLYCLVAWFQA